MEIKPSIPSVPKTHEDALTYFISQLDIEMVDTLLDDERTYQDFPKWEFIAKLQKVFDAFIQNGDKKLLISPGQCGACDCSNKNKPGYLFVGEQTKNFFSLIFERDNKQHVTDLYECSEFAETNKPESQIGKRIWIDPF